MFHHILEIHHEKFYLRYEGTHNLNQLRLKEEYGAESFLAAFGEFRSKWNCPEEYDRIKRVLAESIQEQT